LEIKGRTTQTDVVEVDEVMNRVGTSSIYVVVVDHRPQIYFEHI